MSWPNSPEGQAFRQGVSTCHSPVARVDVSELADAELCAELCAQIRSLQVSVPYLAPTEILTLWTLLVDSFPPLNAAQAEKALEQVKTYLDSL